MKRRSFLKNLGAGAAGMLVATQHLQGNTATLQRPNVWQYPYPQSLDQAKTADGHLLVRLAFEPADPKTEATFRGTVKVSKGHIKEVRNWFFEQGDHFDASRGLCNLQTSGNLTDVVMYRLDEFSEATRFSWTINKTAFSFTLSEVFQAKELQWKDQTGMITANILFDKEIGEINLADYGIADPGDEFTFAVMADPQGGDPSAEPPDLRTRMKIHNAFIEENVAMINRLERTPAFTMVVGDVVDAWGYEKDFAQMNAFLQKLKTPLLYELGNHETEHNLAFGPGYRMDGFNNYFAAQQAVSGFTKLLYSFNAGRWHFVVWPDPMRTNFWETHPHYFDWLEKDLEKYSDRPVVFFQHVPIHPIGIDPFNDYYCEAVHIKRLVLDILARRGNVRYVLSGHVHIPVRASVKTAVEYKGIKFINLPAAGYRPRGFGEEDYFGGPSQGSALVQVNGDKAQVWYKTITEDEFRYPEKMPAFDEKAYALWFNNKWEVECADNFRNPNFTNGLDNWIRNYIYEEDERPSVVCQAQKEIHNEPDALYSYTRLRGYMAPGQDRLPQGINRAAQVVFCKGANPVISFRYRIDGANSDFNGRCGAFVLIEGFRGTHKRVNLVYSAHMAWANVVGKQEGAGLVPDVQVGLDNTPDVWHKAVLNLAADHDQYSKAAKFATLGIDRIALTVGTWSMNDGTEQPFAAWFTAFNIEYKDAGPSAVNGNPLSEKPDAKRWWMGKDLKRTSYGGEHRYFVHKDK